VKSLDICAPAHANAFMGADRLTGLCMPCSMLVFTKDGKTRIAAMRPGAVVPRLFPQAAQQLSDLPDKIDAEIEAILDTAARG
jgi:uncharacterized protein (DUF302 family)